MLETNLTVKEIQTAIANTFNVRKNVFIPNVSWGYFKTHEADLVSIQNHYLYEYEIKRSWSDFLADFKKDTTHFEGKVFKFYYVVPKSIVDKCDEFLANYEWSEPYTKEHGWPYDKYPCGLLFYDEDPNEWVGTKTNAPELARYTNSTNKEYRLFLEEENALMRLGCMRLWSKNALNENKQDIKTDEEK